MRAGWHSWNLPGGPSRRVTGRAGPGGSDPVPRVDASRLEALRSDRGRDSHLRKRLSASEAGSQLTRRLRFGPSEDVGGYAKESVLFLCIFGDCDGSRASLREGSTSLFSPRAAAKSEEACAKLQTVQSTFFPPAWPLFQPPLRFQIMVPSRTSQQGAGRRVFVCLFVFPLNFTCVSS